MKTTASVLLVDDDSAFRHVMSGELRRLGHEVATAGSGEEAVARLIEPTAREHMVKVEVQTMPGGMHVRAEEAELQHTLINLLLNAVQASPPGSRVSVEAEMREQVHLRVADNGCGIAPEDQKRIFEPFFSRRQGGTGLGLFLSLNFVRRWGGDLHVTSELGRGSTFEIVLPALVQP